jgi:hypothetical protein
MGDAPAGGICPFDSLLELARVEEKQVQVERSHRTARWVNVAQQPGLRFLPDLYGMKIPP